MAERQISSIPAGVAYLDDKTSEPHSNKTERLMKAILQMKKSDLAALKKANEGE